MRKASQTFMSGVRLWFDHDGLRHRIDGPAVESPDGMKKWLVHGVMERTNGPAVEPVGASPRWYLKGVRLEQDEPRLISIKLAMYQQWKMRTRRTRR